MLMLTLTGKEEKVKTWHNVVFLEYQHYTSFHEFISKFPFVSTSCLPLFEVVHHKWMDICQNSWVYS